jgi:FkbM family methyltransferase
MHTQTVLPSLALKAWAFVRKRDFRGFWRAAKRRITDPDAATIDRWYRDGCEDTLRLEYPLTSESVVFDVGGYRGDFTEKIAARYDSWVYVFEPVPAFFDLLVERFRSNPKVKIFNFGLSKRDGVASIALSDNGSSVYRRADATASIQMRDIRSIVEELEVKRIDLIKINIEGGEYVLLSRMLEEDILPMCQDLQIQFHRFYPNAKALRAEIRSALRRTHTLTYDYPFIWENWRRKPVQTSGSDAISE